MAAYFIVDLDIRDPVGILRAISTGSHGVGTIIASEKVGPARGMA